MRIEKIEGITPLGDARLKMYFDEYPRVYGRIVGIDAPILICWHSDLIEPTLIRQGDVLLLGVDSGFAIYHIVQKSLVALIPLNSRFISGLVRKRSIVIIAELEVFVLNVNGHSIMYHTGLPDVVEIYQENEEGIKIICMDKTVLNIPC